MRKFYIICFIAVFISTVAFSQIRIALAGGGHSSSVIETNNLPDWSDLKNKYSSRTGAHFGFIADLSLGSNSKFFVQPSILFYNKGRKFFSDYDTSIFNYFSIGKKEFINYIDAPLNLVYKIPMGKNSRLFIGAGPYLSFFYNGREKTETYLKTGSVTTDDNTDLPVGNAPGKYKTMDFGANGTVGVEFGKAFLAANFSRSIPDFYQANYEGSFKHQVIGITAGVFINKPVVSEPVIRDKDKDGIADDKDNCPAEPGSPVTNGCPDADADGMADKDDKCPQEKGIVKYNGCPMKDKDGDTVPDEEDKCPDVPGLARYNGCLPPDTDNDGINDESDKCKTTPGFAKYEGCPVPDTDEDGFNDEEDECPTLAGTKENKGCPEIKKEIAEKVEYAAKRIQFELGKATLKGDSKKVLNEVAVILNNEPGIRLDIEGHTSSEGSLSVNMKLSEDRASAVKNYLLSKGVEENRLTSQGFGPTQPLNDGKTEKEKALNRRVELKLRNY
jgi:outer membrane protein OmpA-like peptidoglycan-associated protein